MNGGENNLTLPLPPFSIYALFHFPLTCPHTSLTLSLPPQGRPEAGGGHVEGQAGPVHLCARVAVPELLRADARLRPADRAAPAAAHPARRVLRPGTTGETPARMPS